MNIKSVKSFVATAGFAVAAIAMGATPAAAQQSINDILQNVRQNQAEVQAENDRRVAEFQQQANRQTALLNQARQELNQLEAEARRVQARFDEGDREQARLEVELKAAQGEFNEVFGVARDQAGQFAAKLESSMISAQYPDRVDELKELAESPVLPSTEQLNSIWQYVLGEMEAQREVASFTTTVANVGPDVEVTRVGPFAMFMNNGDYVMYEATNEEDSLALSPIPKNPGGQVGSATGKVINAADGTLTVAPIDPSRGELLKTLEREKSFMERIQDGGTIGYIIIALAIAGVLFGLFRLFMLFMTSNAVRSQARSSTPSKSNPLGRVMLAYEEAKHKDDETVELKMDEAILRESPKLEFGLSLLKLAAGIAPLLGLLGTVTGMIQTFQAMMIYGTGDPQLMAGGISEALVTTMLGLIAAIPLLIVHSFCASMARGVQGTLEEQAAGIVARHVEAQKS